MAKEVQADKPVGVPSFLDSIIIVLLSISCVLFLFWLVSRLIDLSSFENLPDWLAAAFSSVWAWLVAAASGVGVFTFRYFTARDASNPNFLKWIMTTVFFILLFVVLVLAIYFLAAKIPRPTRSRNDFHYRFVISNEADGVDWVYKFTVTGRYEFKEGKLLGHVERASIRAVGHDVDLQWIEVSACENVGDTWMVYPEKTTADQTITVYRHVAKGTSAEIEDKFFEIAIPSNIIAKKPWLCAAIQTEERLPGNGVNKGELVQATVYAHSISKEPINF